MNNSSFDAAIVGAGASGLMAARVLSAAGKSVLVLEAANEAGGRIRTLKDADLPLPVEAGAEFVHGELPLTLELLKTAGISFHPVKGKMINVRKGRQAGGRDNPQGWGELMKKMETLDEDMPLSLCLETQFPGPGHAGLRDSARRFAQGFDLADIHTVSTRALYREWSDEEHEQYRIQGGYGRLVSWLLEECIRQGCTIHFSEPVEQIRWETDRVVMITGKGRSFIANKAVVTVPLGMLQSAGAESIRFSPDIGPYFQAAGTMGYGTVIKILLQFSNRFWDKKEKKLGFVLSDESIPTWWTQYPDENPLLTGWVPGVLVKGLLGAAGEGEKREEAILGHSLSALSNIFHIDEEELRTDLIAFRIIDWSSEPFIRGGYSFETVYSAAARKILTQPIQDTLFFAGEALYEGDWPGTVEAALNDGQRVACLMHTDRAGTGSHHEKP